MRKQPTSSPALTRVLRIDAAASGAMGLLLAIDAGALHSTLGLSVPLLRGAGLILVPFAAALLVLAPRAGGAPGLVRLIMAGNVLWILASIALIAAKSASITLLGELFVLVQAVAVALFVYLESRAIRDSRSPLAPGRPA